MRLFFHFLLFLGIFVLCLEAQKDSIRWCVWPEEESKCLEFYSRIKAEGGTPFTCSKKNSPHECFEAIENHKADFMILDERLMFEALQNKNKLRPIVSEVYGTLEQPRKHYYSVALVKKSSKFQMNQLQGVKSCHTAHNGFSGWFGPISFLRPFLKWNGSSEALENSVSKFFSGSCVPCMNDNEHSKLCSLCVGRGRRHCTCSKKEPYFDFSGAFWCLKDTMGDVAFVRESTIFDEVKNQADRNEYELLCPDNTRKPVDKFKECNLGKTPSLVMLARTVDNKEDLIWKVLGQTQENHGTGSPQSFQFIGLKDSWKDLLFSKAAIGVSRIPSDLDMKTYLGSSYLDAIQNLTLR